MARRSARPRGRRLRGERGQEMAIEIMVLTPVVLMLLLAVTWAGRYATSHGRVSDVAGAAARAASLADSPEAGRAAALHTVSSSSLATSCTSVVPSFSVTEAAAGQGGAWRGASVTVTVRCTVKNTTLTGVWAPGVVTLTGTATHPVDAFRAG